MKNTVQTEFAISDEFVLVVLLEFKSLENEDLLRESMNFNLVRNLQIFKIFHHFYNFLQTNSRVQNPSLVEHESWYSGEMKLQYNLKRLNFTELVT